jgi:hypothetical protein
MILEPVNPEGNDVILYDTINDCTIAALETSTLPPPPLREENVPPPPSPSPLVPSPPETNEILTNLVNFLQQHNTKLERVQKSQEKILTEVATQIDEARRNNEGANERPHDD